jgi:AraC family transcriptional regulator, arabinose operon regulatory protein
MDNKVDDKNMELIKSYLSSLHVSLDTAAYTKCPLDWRDIDYTPDYNKFYFILGGEGRLKIGEKEYYPRSGQLFLMPAGIKQSYSVVNDNTFTKYWCHFKAVIGEINLFDIVSVPYHINVADINAVECIFRRLVTFYENNSLTSPLQSSGVLCELVAYYLEEASGQYLLPKDSESADKVFELVRYIDTNLSKGITINELAEKMHYHPNYFIRFFKKHFGISPAHYINNKKMEKSKILLKAGNASISDIAFQTGFKDIYHFSKTFKSHTGFSPSEYRKMIL